MASRYRVERTLGEGGMGRVFAAIDQDLGRRVAIKLIREDLDDPSAREKFLREARAAAALSHPNACQLFEASVHDGVPFLVMELLEGEALSARLTRGTLTVDEAIAIALPLLDALKAVHKAGLVHRDLKPSNVFLTAQGVKLLDFGLARRSQRGDALTAPSLTAPGAITGTLRYMAPEQLAGDPVDIRTDIFSLGVMLFEMVTGRIPFGDGTNVDWVNAVLTEAPASLDEPHLKPLDPVVARALQRRPEDRYATVDEMATALRRVLAGRDAAPPRDEARSNGGVRAVVLPFRLLQHDPDIAALQDGVPEVLTALLSRGRKWHFLSNRVAQEFANEPDLLAVGRSLRVDRLLTGSILRAGDDLRVTVQLVNASDGDVQWSETSRHRVDSVLALQDEISKRIVEALPQDGDGPRKPADASRHTEECH